MRNFSLSHWSIPEKGFITLVSSLQGSHTVRKTLVLIALLLGAVSVGQAQVYYTLSDGGPTSNTDQLRRINLDGMNDVLIRSNFIATPGPVVLDAANKRLLIADVRFSQASTGLSNTKIVAVSLEPGNAVSTLVTPPYITGSASTVVTGMALDRINNYLYYTLSDGGPTSNTDQLRRINLDGMNDVLIRSNFIATPGPVVLDAANKRLLIADVRFSQASTGLSNTKIVAVSLEPGNAVSTLVTPSYITGSASTVIGGLTVTNQDPPTVTTNFITTFGSTSATLGGDVTADGGVAVTERGIVYSAATNTPTTATGTKQAIDSGIGGFSQVVTGLTGTTTYYVRAYAINNITTSYGAVQTFTTLAPNNTPTDIALTSASVAENQAVNTLVGSFSTTDADAGQTFTYSLVSGTGSTNNSSFRIVGNQLQTNAVFDFETKASYSIRVQTTDNGSPAQSTQKAFTITITNINELTVSLSARTNATCNGSANGTASATVSGEAAPYSYRWLNTGTNTTLAQTGSAVTGLTAGFYSLTVTATSSGFTATTSFAIDQPAALSLTISETRVSTVGGNNGTATVSVSGGTPGYSYDWSPDNLTGEGTNSVSNLSAGIYSVRVTDAGSCTATTSINVLTVPDLMPILYARPSTISSTTAITVVVDVLELNNTTTSGLITVRISRDENITLSLLASATLIDNRPVQNGVWSFDESDPFYYTLTTSQSIGAGSQLSFGLTGTLSRASTTGTLTISSTLQAAPEQDGKPNNNIDSDKIDYFQP